MSPQDIGGIHPTAMNHPNEKIPAVHVNRHILEIHMKAVLFAKNNPHSLSVGIVWVSFRLSVIFNSLANIQASQNHRDQEEENDECRRV